MTGALTIADLAGRLEQLDARCIRCGRVKSLPLARLRTLYGPAARLPDLRAVLVRRCDRAGLRDQERCDVVFEQLGGLG